MLMNRNRKLLTLALICLFFSLMRAVRAQDDDIRRDATVRAVEMVMPSVVNIATRSTATVRDVFGRESSNESISAGSGVVIDENGYLLTNEHVVHGAEEIQVRFGTGTNDYEATVVASDARNDVALLQLKCRPGEKFHPIKLARADDLLLGETVIALGNPLGVGLSVTRGILSSKSRVALREGEQPDWRNWLQTDAAINHGNSGGPLVNLRGELIGINNRVYDQLPNGVRVQGFGFAIPVRELEEALSDLSTEFVKSYWFGARVKVGSYPLVISSVQPESPAGRAGLMVGDVVLEVNGKIPKTFINFGDLLATNADEQFPLTIRRGENITEVNLRLVRDDSVFNVAMVRSKLGLALEKSPNGFVITEVEPGSPASGIGFLQPGVIIEAIDMQELPKDVTGVAKLLYAKKKGETALLDLAAIRQLGNFNVIQHQRVGLTLR